MISAVATSIMIHHATFFFIDWERVFGRCFSLSMQVKQLEVVLKENSEAELDLLVINKMLRELAAIEADVLSHSEAVLRGRLSKSQRQLIFDEQLKYTALTAHKPQKVCIKNKVIGDRYLPTIYLGPKPVVPKVRKPTRAWILPEL